MNQKRTFVVRQRKGKHYYVVATVHCTLQKAWNISEALARMAYGDGKVVWCSRNMNRSYKAKPEGHCEFFKDQYFQFDEVEK